MRMDVYKWGWIVSGWMEILGLIDVVDVCGLDVNIGVGVRCMVGVNRQGDD